jgi:hypothetical protein
LSTTKKGSVVKNRPNFTLRGILPTTFNVVPSADEGLRSSFSRSLVDKPNNLRVEGLMHDTFAPVSGNASAWIDSPSWVDNVTSMFSRGSNSEFVTESDPTPRLLA